MGSHFTDPADTERKTLMILRILHEAGQPVGSRIIARQMHEKGFPSSERAVRYHLKFMDERGLTRLIGKRDGRVITDMGIEEVSNARVHDKVGLAISRIEILAFQTTFNPATRSGSLPINISLFTKDVFGDAVRLMAPVFEAGYTVSQLTATAGEGQRLGGILIPEGKIGFATVCSLVVNGVLLKNGIPMDSKFGGILQVKKGKPLRFVELIYYSGSSLDPSEAFIRGRMTSIRDVIDSGMGKILANFREIPAPCMDQARDIVASLRKTGIDGVLTIGETGEAVCQIPVDIHKVGMILLGGLNPVACVCEADIPNDNYAMSTMLEYKDLKPFAEVRKAFA